jgi:hypothetical protein
VDIGTVIVIAGVVGILLALGIAVAGESAWSSVGRGGLSLDEPDRTPPPPPGSAAARAEADAEIRQMVEARSARREARGQAPLDVEAEIAALTESEGGGELVGGGGAAGSGGMAGGGDTAGAAGGDPALREEVRQLVVARNERRARRGEAPLEVEAEIDRMLADSGG